MKSCTQTWLAGKCSYNFLGFYVKTISGWGPFPLPCLIKRGDPWGAWFCDVQNGLSCRQVNWATITCKEKRGSHAEKPPVIWKNDGRWKFNLHAARLCWCFGFCWQGLAEIVMFTFEQNYSSVIKHSESLGKPLEMEATRYAMITGG